MKIAVLGAGAWGTALAVSLAGRHEVSLWARSAVQVAEMASSRRNSRYLPDISLPSSLHFESNFAALLGPAELALAVVPSSGLRMLLRDVNVLAPGVPVVWACKGFEEGSRKLPHQVASDELNPDTPRGVLSGPSFAREVALGLPTALTLASLDEMFAHRVALALHSHHLRVYASKDIMGVELGGAVKNVLAIAAGISDGMGFGHNARAALITRGLAEITRLGLVLGGRQETFMGLAGMGDLILTCTGDLSRNRQVGLQLAQGKSLAHILGGLGHVAEGVNTAREVLSLAQQHKVEMPITEAVYQVLYQDLSPRTAVESLLNRVPSAEFKH
ncbi:MAG: NAD(P)-dependent glycerol-3-phosphate dehydrogenase [Gammaproteobacteria bacterium]|nr:NAD(P)-dependent glycerol-3-phosphate dehydrogenase [Gammaproteobacteria bacterium]MBU1733251.1 NAD(P)-dependent glycerol-3-phosphate dehydrogenase [Gammaproteobacteria bacterium]MBU1892299.1 NAD(P)-dependent glycerol-3-phosphate dehydrogenase [Gammaproteobacteria bacterium]